MSHWSESFFIRTHYLNKNFGWLSARYCVVRMSQNVSHSYCTAEKLTATCFRDPVYCKVLRQDINFTSASAVVPCCGQRCLQRLLLWFAITINTPNLLWLEETSDACNYAPEIALCMYVCTYTLIAQKEETIYQSCVQQLALLCTIQKVPSKHLKWGHLHSNQFEQKPFCSDRAARSVKRDDTIKSYLRMPFNCQCSTRTVGETCTDVGKSAFRHNKDFKRGLFVCLHCALQRLSARSFFSLAHCK